MSAQTEVSNDRFWTKELTKQMAGVVDRESTSNGVVIDIGCGAHKQHGTIGIDRRKVQGVNLVCDFERGLPLKDSSIGEAYSIHSIEHMLDVITFMEELYRVCTHGARVYVKTPYYASRKAFIDPTHVRFMTEESFEYFKQPNYYGFKTNFRTVLIHYNMRKPFKYFPSYLQKRCRRYLWNVCEEMTVVLEVIK